MSTLELFLVDHIQLETHDKPVSEEQEKLRRRAEKGAIWALMPSQAAQVLEKVRRGQYLIEAEGLTRADIARGEGISRARVTQMMKLPDDLAFRFVFTFESLSFESRRAAVGALIARIVIDSQAETITIEFGIKKQSEDSESSLWSGLVGDGRFELPTSTV